MSSGHVHTTLGKAKYNKTMAGSLPSHAAPARSNGVFRLDTARTRKVRKEKEKKMGWFRKKFNNWVRQAWESAREEEVCTETLRARDSLGGKSSIRFTIYAAQGGNIIEYYKQDRYKEHDGPELVLVTGDQTIGQAVEHILTMEALKS
jgi:hypothetical protein